jgi:hypothetical protein
MGVRQHLDVASILATLAADVTTLQDGIIGNGFGLVQSHFLIVEEATLPVFPNLDGDSAVAGIQLN